MFTLHWKSAEFTAQSLSGQTLGQSTEGRLQANESPSQTITDETLAQTLALLDVLKSKKINYQTIIEMGQQLKNNLRETDETNDKKNFAIALNKILEQEEFANLDNIINNISILINQKFERDFYAKKFREDREFFAFLAWLQDIFLLAQVLQQPCYQEALARIESFKQKAQLSWFDKMFRYAVAANTGIGASSCFLNFGPMILLGILGFLDITVPPLGVALTTVVFGIIAVGLGCALGYSFLKTYADEDNNLLNDISDAEKEIHDLAISEAHLRKKRDCLKYKNLYLLSKLGAPDPLKIISGATPEIGCTITPEVKPTKHKSAVGQWGQTVLSFFGSLGTTWGFPTLILGLAGITLLVGTSFSTAGISLAVITLVSAAAFAIKTYHYQSKSKKCEAELDEIKTSNLQHIKAHIHDESLKYENLLSQKEAMQLQIINRELQRADQVKAQSLEKDFLDVDAKNMPVILPQTSSVIYQTKPRR